MTLDVTEMPRSCSSFIQSDVAWRAARRDLTEPARWIAPPYSNSFSVRVVLPASGWLMIAKVRRVFTASCNRVSRSTGNGTTFIQGVQSSEGRIPQDLALGHIK